jgi:hypothetical protein
MITKYKDFNIENDIFYHGTCNMNFDDFNLNDVNYFTKDYEYAKLYMNSSFSALRFNKTTDKPGIITVKLHCNKIFDTKHNIKDRRIFEKYTSTEGNMTPLDKSGYVDWSDAENLAEYFENHHMNYDCIIIEDAYGIIAYATIGKNKVEIINKEFA